MCRQAGRQTLAENRRDNENELNTHVKDAWFQKHMCMLAHTHMLALKGDSEE